MGRRSPWTREEYVSLYNKVNQYGARLSAHLLIQEGVDSAAEARMSYSLYACPIAYLFIHYHYGEFKELHIGENDKLLYLGMFLPEAKHFASEMKDTFVSGQVFLNDTNGMGATLAKMCDEIIYIEDNL